MISCPNYSDILSSTKYKNMVDSWNKYDLSYYRNLYKSFGKDASTVDT